MFGLGEDGMDIDYVWEPKHDGNGQTYHLSDIVPLPVDRDLLLDWLRTAREKVRRADELRAEIVALGVRVGE